MRKLATIAIVIFVFTSGFLSGRAAGQERVVQHRSHSAGGLTRTIGRVSGGLSSAPTWTTPASTEPPGVHSPVRLAVPTTWASAAASSTTIYVPTPAYGLNSFLSCVVQVESGGDPTAQNPYSSASGLFGDLNSTWGGYGGYASAKDAPVSVQIQMNQELYAQAGTSPWAGDGCA